MPNIPPKSRGCVTCRRRKVKCDEARPVCKRCVKASRKCEGYTNLAERTHIIVYGEGHRQTCWRLPDDSSSTSPQQSVSSDSRSTAIDFQPLEGSAFMYGSFDAFDASNPGFTLTGPNLRAFQDNICVSFLSNQLFPHSVLGEFDSNWLINACKKDTSLATFYAACCTGNVLMGRLKGTPTAMSQGFSHYGRALKQLAVNLKDPKFIDSPYNVAAVILLNLFEVTAFKNSYGWVEHAGGVGRMLQAHGPQAYTEQPSRTYFVMARLLTITRALTIRRRTFLEDDDWCTIPWSSCPHEKKPLHYIIDILARVPGLLEDSDRFLVQPPSSAELEDFRNRLVSTLQMLFEWRWNFELEEANAIIEVATDLHNADGVDEYGVPIFEHVFWFADFHHVCRPIVMYNLCLLLVLDLGRRLKIPDMCALALQRSAKVAAPPPRSNPLYMPSAELSLRHVVLEMCRSMLYQLEEQHVTAGGLLMLLPVRVLLYFLPPGREKKWILRMLFKISHASGFKIGERLLENDIATATGLVGQKK